LLVVVNTTRSSTSSVGSGRPQQVPATDADQQQQQQQQHHGAEDEGDSAGAAGAGADAARSRSLSRSSRHSSDDAADDRSRASYSVRFAAVSRLHTHTRLTALCPGLPG